VALHVGHVSGGGGGASSAIRGCPADELTGAAR